MMPWQRLAMVPLGLTDNGGIGIMTAIKGGPIIFLNPPPHFSNTPAFFGPPQVRYLASPCFLTPFPVFMTPLFLPLCLITPPLLALAAGQEA